MKGPRLFCAFPEDLLDQRGAAVLHGAPLACQSLRHGCAVPKGSPWHQGGARSARAVRGAARSKPSKARSVASEPCERSEATMPHCGMLSAKLTEGFFDPSVTAYAVPPFLSSAWSPLCAHGTRLRCSLLHWAYFALFRSSIRNSRLATLPLASLLCSLDFRFACFAHCARRSSVPQGARFVRPFSLREKGGSGAVLLPMAYHFPKRLPCVRGAVSEADSDR